MAVETSLIKHSLCTAAANYSSTASLAGPNGSGQFLLVKYTGTGVAPTATVCSSNADSAVGVLQNDPASGYVADVAIGGVSKVVAGAAVAIGAALMSDTSGRAITQTSTNPIIGYALGQATAANQIIPMQIAPQLAG